MRRPRDHRGPGERVLCLVALVGGLAAPGCGVEFAMVGAATSAGETAMGVFRAGKLTVTRRQPMAGLQRAAEEARAALDLQVVKVDDDEDDFWALVLEDDDGRDITIRLQRRTSLVTQIQIDVGPFGSRSMSQLVYAAINQALPPDEYGPASPPTPEPDEG